MKTDAEKRTDTINTLNGAVARLAAAKNRLEMATFALKEASEKHDAVRTRYAQLREWLLRAEGTPDERLNALSEANDCLAVLGGPGELQRALSEEGVARHLVEKYREERDTQLALLASMLPEF